LIKIKAYLEPVEKPPNFLPQLHCQNVKQLSGRENGAAANQVS
jgi:hypothetical protein